MPERIVADEQTSAPQTPVSGSEDTGVAVLIYIIEDEVELAVDLPQGGQGVGPAARASQVVE